MGGGPLRLDELGKRLSVERVAFDLLGVFYLA